MIAPLRHTEIPGPAFHLGRVAGHAYLSLGDDFSDLPLPTDAGSTLMIAPETPIIDTTDTPISEGTLNLPQLSPLPITSPTILPPIPTVNESVNVGGLQFPAGTVGIDQAGNPVNSGGQVLTPTGAVAGSSAVGLVVPLTQAAATLAQAATASGSLATIYPAPAGAVLPPGAIGVNAQGLPINAAGQVLSTTPVSGTSWFSQSTVMAGIPNWTLLAGGGVLLLLLAGSFAGGRASKRR